MGDGRWEMGDGRWEMGDGDCGVLPVAPRVAADRDPVGTFHGPAEGGPCPRGQHGEREQHGGAGLNRGHLGHLEERL